MVIQIFFKIDLKQNIVINPYGSIFIISALMGWQGWLPLTLTIRVGGKVHHTTIKLWLQLRCAWIPRKDSVAVLANILRCGLVWCNLLMYLCSSLSLSLTLFSAFSTILLASSFFCFKAGFLQNDWVCNWVGDTCTAPHLHDYTCQYRKSTTWSDVIDYNRLQLCTSPPWHTHTVIDWLIDCYCPISDNTYVQNHENTEYTMV